MPLELVRSMNNQVHAAEKMLQQMLPNFRSVVSRIGRSCSEEDQDGVGRASERRHVEAAAGVNARLVSVTGRARTTLDDVTLPISRPVVSLVHAATAYSRGQSVVLGEDEVDEAGVNEDALAILHATTTLPVRLGAAAWGS